MLRAASGHTYLGVELVALVILDNESPCRPPAGAAR